MALVTAFAIVPLRSGPGTPRSAVFGAVANVFLAQLTGPGLSLGLAPDVRNVVSGADTKLLVKPGTYQVTEAGVAFDTAESERLSGVLRAQLNGLPPQFDWSGAQLEIAIVFEADADAAFVDIRI